MGISKQQQKIIVDQVYKQTEKQLAKMFKGKK